MVAVLVVWSKHPLPKPQSGTLNRVTEAATNLPGRAILEARARNLAAITVGWNVLEAAVAIVAGRRAGSTALIGFGLDAVVETFSGLVILWQFRGFAEEKERTALRLIAVGFWLIAAYVAFESVRTLIGGDRPDTSPVGIALAIASLAVMPVLAAAKHRTGHQLGSQAVIADSVQTRLCAYMSSVLLTGLVLDALFGWWWADPVAAMAIAGLAFNEGRAAWRGDRCC